MRLTEKLLMASAIAGTMVLATATTSSADLIYDASILLGAQGFGTAPRDLTIQNSGTDTTESGCVSPDGGFTVGTSACMGTDAFLSGNGVVNTGGDEPSPITDNQKYGAPLASDRGITTASDIGILFNAAEPNGDAISVDDLTLKFYLNGTLIGSIDGQQTFGSSTPGNGVAGFVFRVDSAQLSYVNSLLGMGDVQLALESTVSGSAGGPESFRLVNLGAGAPLPIPEPTSLLLLGSGVGAAAVRARRRKLER